MQNPCACVMTEKKMSKTRTSSAVSGSVRGKPATTVPFLDDAPKILRKKAVTATRATANHQELIYFLAGTFCFIESTFKDRQKRRFKFSELKETLAKEISFYFAELGKNKRCWTNPTI